MPVNPGQQTHVPLLQVPPTQLEHENRLGPKHLLLGCPLHANSHFLVVVLKLKPASQRHVLSALQAPCPPHPQSISQ